MSIFLFRSRKVNSDSSQSKGIVLLLLCLLLHLETGKEDVPNIVKPSEGYLNLILI